MIANIYIFQITLLMMILAALISLLISGIKHFKVIVTDDVRLADFACCMGIFIGMSISLVVSYLFLFD